MKRMKKILFIITIGISLIGCKKEEEEVVVDTTPTISLTKPYDDDHIKLGNYFYIEGVVSDANENFKLYYEISSPEANYNYLDSNSYEYNKTGATFKELIQLDMMASVGKAEIQVWTIDSDGDKSVVLSRSLIFYDQFSPSYEQFETSVNYSDSIIAKGFLNANNIVDSVVIFNYTTSTVLGYGTDVGGFSNVRFKMLILPVYNDIIDEQDFTSAVHLFGFKVSDMNTSLQSHPFRIKLNEFPFSLSDNWFTFTFAVN
jgi:hypothetical protein